MPPIDQIGFVVADLDQAVRLYTPMFGVPQTMDATIEAADYRGRPADCTLRLAMFQSGAMEVELIQVVDGEAIHQEFLAAGRTGPHHIRFTVDDFAAAAAQLRTVGMQPVYGKRFSPGLEFAYFEGPDGVLWELFENHAG